MDTNKWRVFFEKLFGASYKIGNPDRARKRGEKDPDSERLGELNKSWRQMLREDSGMKKLMTYVIILINIAGLLFLTFFISGFFLPVDHWFFTFILIVNLGTIPCWLWVGGWYNKIQKRVFEAFKKRFGKHMHLK